MVTEARESGWRLATSVESDEWVLETPRTRVYVTTEDGKEFTYLNDDPVFCDGAATVPVLDALAEWSRDLTIWPHTPANRLLGWLGMEERDIDSEEFVHGFALMLTYVRAVGEWREWLVPHIARFVIEVCEWEAW